MKIKDLIKTKQFINCIDQLQQVIWKRWCEYTIISEKDSLLFRLSEKDTWQHITFDSVKK